jgi:hypothetical protein
MRLSATRILGGSLVPLAAALAVSGPFAGAESAPLSQASTVKNLWSTVNICDTKSHPDALGVRGRAPGDGSRQNIWMRFFAQYQKNGAWVFVKKGGRSSWIEAGPAAFTWQEHGVTFPFTLKPGESYLMRGLVKFQWRLHGKVVRSSHAYTSSGHHAASGGDPKGYSAATCFNSGGTGVDRSLSPRRRQAKPADRSASRRPPSTRKAARPPAERPRPSAATPATSAP